MVCWRDDLAHVRHDHIPPQVRCKAHRRLQLLHEALTQRGIVCPKTDTPVARVNGQMQPVLFDNRAYTVSFSQHCRRSGQKW